MIILATILQYTNNQEEPCNIPILTHTLHWCFSHIPVPNAILSACELVVTIQRLQEVASITNVLARRPWRQVQVVIDDPSVSNLRQLRALVIRWNCSFRIVMILL